MSRIMSGITNSEQKSSQSNVYSMDYTDTIFLVSYLCKFILHLHCIIQTAASWILANVLSDSEHKGIIIISPWHWTQSDVLIC